ncbi:MAG: DUF2892 domain-containing protein [Pseudomonadota bacterium]
MFKKNASSMDRIARIVIAAICIYLGFIDSSIIGDQLLAIALGVFGVVNLFVAFSGFCPVYALAGISTCKAPKE